MAGITWQTGIAVGIQSAFGTVSPTIPGLGTAVDETDGAVLGDRESGDGESGITLPSIVRISRERADLGFSRQKDSFQRQEGQGLSIAFELKGNGSTTTTPLAGEAKPLPGIDAIMESAGLTGANGTAPVYEYTPTPNVSNYATIKLWDGDLSFVFQDCIIESLELPQTGGEIVIAVANYRIGQINSIQAETFPTFTYGTMATLSAPSVVSAGFVHGTSREFQEANININNNIEEIPAGNQISGRRLSQTTRRIDFSGLLDDDVAVPLFDYNNIADTLSNLEDVTWRIGVAAGGTDLVNGVSFDISELQTLDVKADRGGDLRQVQIEGQATSVAAAGDEFKITFD
jgi:hypothetical protein